MAPKFKLVQFHTFRRTGYGAGRKSRFDEIDHALRQTMLYQKENIYFTLHAKKAEVGGGGGEGRVGKEKVRGK